MPAAAEAFGGFPAEAREFLAGLAANNTRGWFEANRGTYDEAIARPARAFVGALGPELRKTISPGIEFEPRVGKSLFRINRDLRFSKDKTPYNPWLDLVFWEGPNARTAPSLFLRIAATEVVLGAGVFALRGSDLDRYRDTVANTTRGADLSSILARLRREWPHVETNEPTRARVPAGFPQDHPQADLLRRDALHAALRLPVPRTLHAARFTGWCCERYRSFAPLHRWLVETLSS